MSIKLSEEQQIIVTLIKAGYNIEVDACAGTGKTTVILEIAKLLARRKFLEITYNSTLRNEVKDKVKKRGLNNVNVHTFHSLAVKYYHSSAYTDNGIRHILLNNIKPVIPIELFNVLVLDEAQDMTLLYFRFICKVIKDMGSPIQLLILGDYKQGLYEFKGSDIRFLTYSTEIWKNHPLLKKKAFRKCTMKMSFRITNQICSFVNDAMLGEQRMLSCRDDNAVFYSSNNQVGIKNIVFSEIMKLLDNGARPDEIFILSGSVKGIHGIVHKLENLLTENNIPCFVPMLENEKPDERVINKKIVFSTFHGVKGRERKYVFIIGFDNSYFSYYGKNLPKDECPNTLYVGATRAINRLYLLESSHYANDRPLEFLKMTHHELKNSDFVQFKGFPRSYFYEDNELKASNLTQRFKTTPTKMISFLNDSVIEEIYPVIAKIFITESPEHNVIDIPTMIETRKGFVEEVSDLNGIAIPCMYYDYLTEIWRTKNGLDKEDSILHKIISEKINVLNPNENSYLRTIVDNLPTKIESIDEYLYLASVSIAIQESLYFKLKQIDRDEYTWLNEKMVSVCNDRLGNVVGTECINIQPKIEETIIHESCEEEHANIDKVLEPYFEPNTKFRFTGITDIITENTIWELKCTSTISIDNILQTCIYAWLWRTMYPDDKKDVKIFNIKTGEILRLDATIDELTYIVVSILKGKYVENQPKTDDVFLHECERIIQEWEKP